MDRIQKINKDYYNKNASVWASEKTDAFYDESAFREFITHLKSGDTVLDIGCGHGRNIPLFLGIGRKLRYEGLDISNKLLEIAKARYPQSKFHCANILDRKKLPKKKHDGFWASACLQHIPDADWDMMLENIGYLLKKGGVGYMSLPSDRLKDKLEVDSRYFNLFSKKKLEKILHEHGWKILDHGTLPSTRRTSYWLWFIVRIPKAKRK